MRVAGGAGGDALQPAGGDDGVGVQNHHIGRSGGGERGIGVAGEAEVVGVAHPRYRQRAALLPGIKHASHARSGGGIIGNVDRAACGQRSDERRVGSEGVSTCSSRLSPYDSKKKTTKSTTKED